MADLNEEYPLYSPPVDITERISMALNNPETLLGIGVVVFLVVFFYLLDRWIDKE